MTIVFELSIYASLIVFVLLGAVFFIFGRFMLHFFASYEKKHQRSIPNGAFVGVIATAWALSLGFVAADIWAIGAKAYTAMHNERSAIMRLIGVAVSPVIDAPELHETLIEYRTSVIEDEWSKNINLHPALSVEKNLQKIRNSILMLTRADTPASIVTHLLNDLDVLQDSRNMRLSVGSASVDTYKLYLVLLLTVMTNVTIASTHADRIRAGSVALLIYSFSAALCLWILSIHANPYQGPEKMEPQLLLIESMSTSIAKHSRA